MALPSTVTSRAEGNEFVATTGMEISVQTGFAIRTGFYLTNSGSYGVDVTMVTNNTELAFDFISGVQSEISLPAGSTRLIPFDFYGLKDVSGPVAGSTGPAGTGAYTVSPVLTVRSKINNQTDPEGTIRVRITGYVTGAINRSAVVGPQPDIAPQHPSGFLVLTGKLSDGGKPYNQLQWKNPSTGYYFEEYQLQYSDTNTQSASWADVSSASLSFDRKYEINGESLTNITVGSDSIDSYYYGTPTGLVGNEDYLDQNLSFDSDYYYRIRGVHYGLDQSTVMTTTDWVYGYAVNDLSYDGLNNDILTGLVTGSSTLPSDNSVDPSTILNAKTAKKQAMITYLKDGESDININSKFNSELTERNISLQDFTDNFSGYHVVVPVGYAVGSKTVGKAAIETGDRILDSNSSEVKVLLKLQSNSLVAGRGGDGGDGGWIRGELRSQMTSARTTKVIVVYTGTQPSTEGRNGDAAIKITNSDITEFKIFAHYSSKIYGGGGGGAGGDTTWFTNPVLARSVGINNRIQITGGANGQVLSVTENENRRNEQTYVFSVKDIVGVTMAGIGGGGQGFTSKGGLNIYRNLLHIQGNGSLEGPGAGTERSYQQKIGQGGTGGVFGAIGDRLQSEDALSIESNRNYRSNARLPGLAGYAIDAQSANYTTYQSANFRSNLFYITKPAASSDVSSINGFFARWTADQKAYNAGTTQATDNQTVEKWEAVEYASALSSTIPYLEQTTNSRKPYFRNSTSRADTKYFGQKAHIGFAGNLKHMRFYNVVDEDANDTYFRSNMPGFEVFYNLIPRTDGFDYRQFNANGHYPLTFKLHQWGKNNNTSKMYTRDLKVVESMGLEDNRFTFKDQFWGGEGGFLNPSSSFVYNVSVKKINSNRFVHEVYSGTELQSSNTIINRELYFNSDNTAYLGDQVQAGGGASFCISDIILFNKALSDSERQAVNTFLVNKNRVFYTATVTDITGTNYTNTLNKQSSQIPTNTLLMNNGMAGYIITPESP